MLQTLCVHHAKVESCPQAITEEEAKAKVNDTSLPGNTVELRTTFHGEHQETSRIGGMITKGKVLQQFQFCSV